MIRKFNFLAGVLLAMSAVVSCGSDDDNKGKTKDQLITDAKGAIDKMEKKDLAEVAKVTSETTTTLPENLSDAKTAVKKMLTDAVAKAEKEGKEKAEQAATALEAKKSNMKSEKAKDFADILCNILKKIAEEKKKK